MLLYMPPVSYDGGLGYTQFSVVHGSVLEGKIQEIIRPKEMTFSERSLALLVMSNHPFPGLSQSFPNTVQMRFNYIRVKSLSRVYPRLPYLVFCTIEN